jgi:hypothetical protein
VAFAIGGPLPGSHVAYEDVLAVAKGKVLLRVSVTRDKAGDAPMEAIAALLRTQLAKVPAT